MTGRTQVRNSLRTIDSQNVVARLPGTGAPDEVVIYMAHWDHLGKDESLTGDQIYNGAADNATGTAGLIELARAFTEGEPPRRSVLFLAVTAEEQGLLGSRYYGENPLYPAAQTVAALNMDVLNQWGRTSDLTIVGMGQSQLDEVAGEIAGRLGRVLNPGPRSRRRASTTGQTISRLPERGFPPSMPTPGWTTWTSRPATGSKSGRSTPRTTTTRSRTR